MGKNIDIFKKREKGEQIILEKSTDSTEKTEKRLSENVIVGNTKNKIRGMPIEVMVEDLPKFDLALLKLSNRDGVLYRKKDIYIAMTKYFFKTIEENPERIEIEKY
ncbi:MAG: hypothetical protein FWF51_07100 [Chitinivibrionia bacterium]|nr:hypothetical protein [Chitinivibrionia bacterium]